MIDELKQWEYDKGYEKGKADMLKVIEDIKAEIKAYKDSVDKAISEDELKREGMKLAYQDSIEIIDKHIGGDKE